MSWIWLDGVASFERAKSVKAWKEWEPSFPLAYLVEFIAQAGAILLGAESDFQEDIVFTKVEKAEFSAHPKPDRRVDIEVEADGLRREGGWFAGRVTQDGTKLMEGRVLLMNVGRLKPGSPGPITFPRDLVEALK